jgi:hypothetical protein
MTNLIEINYNTSYSYKLNIDSTYFYINHDYITIEQTTGIIHISSGLDVGQYNIIVN